MVLCARVGEFFRRTPTRPDEDHFGYRLTTYLRAPASGDYIFWLASDDQGELRIGSAESKLSGRKIAYVTGQTSEEEWDTRDGRPEPQQQSAPIPLDRGVYYRLEAVVQEQDGGVAITLQWA